MPRINRRFSVAPMLDWTNRHCRYFHRQLSQHAVLYTEMITTGALLNGEASRFLKYNPEEHPVALQLGGSDAKALAACVKLAENEGYDEINLNCGCPSDRVQNGAFGACLMQTPEVVADAVAAMKAAATYADITVKCRIGVDDQDEDQHLFNFTETLVNAGLTSLCVHARKAWLKGLSPKQNRDIPPLNYQRVYRLKQEFPQLEIQINGGIETLDQALEHLNHVDGVMMGRAVYQSPYILAEVDRRIFGANSDIPKRAEVIDAMVAYASEHLSEHERITSVSRHMLGLFNGLSGTKAFKRKLSEEGHKTDAKPELIRQACEHILANEPT